MTGSENAGFCRTESRGGKRRRLLPRAPPSATVDELPHELLARILQHVPGGAAAGALRLVCRRWAAVVAALTERIEVRGPPPTASAVSRFPRVTHVTLLAGELSQGFAEQLGASCPRLRSLRLLEGCQVADGPLAALADSARDLRELRVESNFALSQVGLTAVATAAPHLERLELVRVMGVGDRMLGNVGARCQQLAALDISCAYTGLSNRLSGDGFRNRDPAGGASWRCVRHLDVSYTNVDDSGLECIAAAMPALEVLGCRFLRDATARGFRHLAARCVALEVLDMADNGDDWVRVLGGVGASHLKRLKLEAYSDVTGPALASLAPGCRQLAEVDFGESNFEPGLELGALDGVNFPSLTRVHMARGDTLLGDTLRALLKACAQLESFRGTLPWDCTAAELKTDYCPRASFEITSLQGGEILVKYLT